MVAGAVMLCGPSTLSGHATDASLRGTLLYSRLTEGTWQVWQANLATDQHVQLTFDTGDKRYPEPIPAGGISYCTSNQTCFSGRAGHSAAPLLPDLWPLRDIAWAPSGESIVFSKFRTDLVDSANLWIASPTGDGRRILTHEPGIQEDAAWSPDGTRIAYSAGQGPDSYEIYIVAADGSTKQQLTQNLANDFQPAWSPDGQQLALSSNVSGDYEIWLVSDDGSGFRQLTTSPGLDARPTWSPDGREIAFTTNRAGRLEVWVMQADGTRQRPLVQVVGGACDPAWR